ncbi:MAG: DUF1501 domain-containing protein [Candidatus Solibacter usitatus]|nr:DUF1501 domain-containing protein [Candidatus Solibacter usitatus]
MDLKKHNGNNPFWMRPSIGRRVFFRHAASAVGGYYLLPSRPMETVAKAAPPLIGKAKQVIYVLMAGGPSQIDTFDLKEGAWLPASARPTSYGDVRWPQGWMPKLAGRLNDVAIVRTVRAWALVHMLCRTWVMIGRNPALSKSLIAPHIGSVVAMEFAGRDVNRMLPAFLHLNTTSGPGSGYLPPQYSPFYLSPGGTGMANTTHRDGQAKFNTRVELLKDLSSELRESAELGSEMQQAYAYQDEARRLTYNPAVDRIFTFDQAERNRYGNTGFGNACISARNILRAKAGTRFIQINTADWDQHDDIYTAGTNHIVRMTEFDNAMGELLGDLKNDGLLDETLIVCMGEFGRIPGNLNNTRGRDHHLQQAALFAGAGVTGGRILGSTNPAGDDIRDSGWARKRYVRFEDIEATIYSALGIDYTTVRRDDPIGRGFEYVPFSDRDLYGPVNELWG